MEKTVKKYDYYAIGIVGRVFDHHLWPNEKEAKDYYNQKLGRSLIKGWKLKTLNGEEYARKFSRIAKRCDEAIGEFEKILKKTSR